MPDDLCRGGWRTRDSAFPQPKRSAGVAGNATALAAGVLLKTGGSWGMGGRSQLPGVLAVVADGPGRWQWAVGEGPSSAAFRARNSKTGVFMQEYKFMQKYKRHEENPLQPGSALISEEGGAAQPCRRTEQRRQPGQPCPVPRWWLSVGEVRRHVPTSSRTRNPTQATSGQPNAESPSRFRSLEEGARHGTKAL